LPASVHSVAAFLPWHRYFVQVYEEALQECGYTGTAMYWDWVADSSAITQSAVWDPVTGFGGNGTGAPQDNDKAPRVMDGPFKDYHPLYWSRDVLPHGLCRNWVVGIPGNPDQMDLNAHRYTPAAIEYAMNQTTYAGFTQELENGPHSAVHFGVGGGGPRNGPPGDLGWNDASPNGMSCFLIGYVTLAEVMLITVRVEQTPSSSSITPRSIVCGGNGSRRTLAPGHLPTRAFAISPTVARSRQLWTILCPWETWHRPLLCVNTWMRTALACAIPTRVL
jgi:hypothetical protein